jgi:hypothetical protein
MCSGTGICRLGLDIGTVGTDQVAGAYRINTLVVQGFVHRLTQRFYAFVRAELWFSWSYFLHCYGLWLHLRFRFLSSH